jgi:glycine hydroxymethyltransferase
MTASSIYFQSFPYSITPDTNVVDCAALAAQAKIFKPRLIICGASAYPRDWDYAEIKKIAVKEGAWLMADIAHTSGLIAAQELKNPFEYADVVTTTTYAFFSLGKLSCISAQFLQSQDSSWSPWWYDLLQKRPRTYA